MYEKQDKEDGQINFSNFVSKQRLPIDFISRLLLALVLLIYGLVLIIIPIQN